ncbi:MAG: acetylxylan esterase [Verrucomicrobiales bacterium]|nr:acetylxylan esterase [Verrucomicrobiales bacterium]
MPRSLPLGRALIRTVPGARQFLLLVALWVVWGLEARTQEPPDTNYDESQVGSYELPDPLLRWDGRKVTTRKRWTAVRRSELLEAFATNVYGRTPSIRILLRPEDVESDKRALDGLATRRQVRLRLFDDPAAPWIDLLMYLPKTVSKPMPVFLGLSYGNQGVNADPGIRPSRDTVSKRGEHAHRWPLERILSRGYAVATFAGADVEQDRHGSGSLQKPDAWRSGIRGYWLQLNGRKELEATDWGSLGAWAWGLSRALDYLEHDSQVDGRRVIVFGHSRTGKAALWAAAQDERFAMAISNNSGQGGAALARRRYGETLAASVSLSGVWYCQNYARFAGRESDLPVDAHELIALMAPRPVYVASAIEDRWADPRGEFLAASAADPVYRLFGRIGLGTNDMPPADRPVGDFVGYHVRSGDHEITPYDWEQYLDFADRHFRR